MVITPLESQMVRAFTNGRTAACTKESLKKVSNTVMENGGNLKIQTRATNSKACTNSTKRMDKERSSGRVETSTQETTSTMREVVMERCTGLMGQSTRVSG